MEHWDYIYIYTYTYIYIYICMCVYIYIYGIRMERLVLGKHRETMERKVFACFRHELWGPLNGPIIQVQDDRKCK